MAVKKSELKRLDLSEQDAKWLLGAINVKLSGFVSDAVGGIIDDTLKHANEMMGGYGIEAIQSEYADPADRGYYGDIAALYVNMGETYQETLLYDTEKEEYFICSWGDWYEEFERDKGIDREENPYKPRHHYTDEELLDAEIADLEIDYRCAIRDGLDDYAKEVSKKLKDLREKKQEAKRTGNPISEAAKEIWRQISTSTKMACGARDIVAHGNGIMFKVGAGREHLSVMVEYNHGGDDYTVRLLKMNPRTYETRELEIHEGIYADNLNEVIYHAVNK